MRLTFDNIIIRLLAVCTLSLVLVVFSEFFWLRCIVDRLLPNWWICVYILLPPPQPPMLDTVGDGAGRLLGELDQEKKEEGYPAFFIPLPSALPILLWLSVIPLFSIPLSIYPFLNWSLQRILPPLFCTKPPAIISIKLDFMCRHPEQTKTRNRLTGIRNWQCAPMEMDKPHFLFCFSRRNRFYCV